MRKKIRLTESDLHRIIQKSVNKIINEGSSENQDYERWETIKEILGPEQMLDTLYDYLDGDTIRELIGWFEKDLDADGAFEDEDMKMRWYGEY